VKPRILTIALLLLACSELQAQPAPYNVIHYSGIVNGPSGGPPISVVVDGVEHPMSGNLQPGLNNLGNWTTEWDFNSSTATGIWSWPQDYPLPPAIVYQWPAALSGGSVLYDAVGHPYRDWQLNMSVTLPSVKSVGPNNQDPQVHGIQQGASVAEPVDAATGYLWYSDTLLKVHGAQEVTYAIYGKYGGLNGSDFGSTYDVLIQVSGVNGAGTPSIQLVSKGRGLHNYYLSKIDWNYHSNEMGAAYDWIQPISNAEYILHRPDQSQYVFLLSPSAGSQQVATGYLTSIVNGHGQQIQITRSPVNPAEISSVTDALSDNGLTYQYTQQGLVSSVTDNLGRDLLFSYASASTMPSQIQLVDGNGQLAKSLNFSYDANGNLFSLSDVDGRLIMLNTYDGQGRIATQQDGRGKLTRFSYGTYNGPAEHHRKFSYQEELRELLKRHRIAFDEHYLWE
jgi:YD repeat-containing protein